MVQITDLPQLATTGAYTQKEKYEQRSGGGEAAAGEAAAGEAAAGEAAAARRRASHLHEGIGTVQ